MRFKPTFDRAGIALSVSAIIILLYLGLSAPTFQEYFRSYWIAFAFWIIGFTGSIGLGLVRRTHLLTLNRLLEIGIYAGLIIMIWGGLNYAYATAIEASTFDVVMKMQSFAIGICEELFFGVFLLSIFINWIGLPRFMAVIISALGHSIYHIPHWGANIPLVMLFSFAFIVARSIYVYIYPYVGVLLGAHGFWNLGVS